MEKINKQILQVAKLGEKTNRDGLQYVHVKDNYIEATDGRILLREYLPTRADKEALIDYVSETEVWTKCNYSDTNRIMPRKKHLKIERDIWEVANLKNPTKGCKEVAILNGITHLNAAYIRLIASFFKDDAYVTVYRTNKDLLFFENQSKCALVCPFRVKFLDNDLVERKGIRFKDFADAKKSKAPTQIYVVKDRATGDVIKAFKTRAGAELYAIHRGECEIVPLVLV